MLQAYCVKCHDGNYDRDFQLVPIKNRAGQTKEALRANLDATLRIIDQDNLAKSELLTASLRAHGKGPRNRPIFPGSNDKAYQILSAWVQSLRSPSDIKEAARAQAARTGADNGEAFAAGRERIGADGAESDLPAVSSGGRRPPLAAGTPSASRIPPPTPFVPRGNVSPEGANQEPPDDFPLPFVLTGKKPNIAAPKSASAPAAQSSRNDGSSSPAPPAGAGTPKSGSPADAAKNGDQAKADDPASAAKKKRKPVTIDPSILERALQNRNGAR